MNLAGSATIVSGAASGIGRGSALSFARRGAAVVVADLDGEGAATVAEEIRSAGGRAVAVKVDVGADGAFETLRDAALGEFGRVDLVMNNVGVLTRGLPEHIPLDEWRRVLEINLLSVVRSHAVFVPHFLGRGSGHIVNTASFAGLFTYAYDRQPYAASKAAIVQITEGLRLYLQPQGIGVTLLCPGPVRTNISVKVHTFGPEIATRGVGVAFEHRDPTDVGELVADAVEANRFMVYTDDAVVDELVARATDWDTFIDHKAKEVATS